MKLLAGRCVAALIVAGCGALPLPASAENQPSSGAACKASYVGTLVVKPDDDGRSLTLTQSYGFADANCTLWMVPAGARVDGASIPQIFWSILGGPFEGKYRNASVIHDWFCDRRTMTWQKVHRMFYDAMLASGVGPVEAKLMYLAVYYQGPRWTEQAIVNNRLLNQFLRPTSTGIDPAMRKRYEEVAFSKDSAISAGVRYIVDQIKQNDVDVDRIDQLAEMARAVDQISDAPPPR